MKNILIICLVLSVVIARAQTAVLTAADKYKKCAAIVGKYPTTQQELETGLNLAASRINLATGEDKYGNTTCYRLNVWYDAERLGNTFVKMEGDYLVAVELVRTNKSAFYLTHPKTGKKLTSCEYLVPPTLKPDYEFFYPTEAQRKKIKDPIDRARVRDGGLLMRKVTTATKKLPQYAR